MSRWNAAEASQDYRRMLEQAARYIEDNLNSEISLNDTARAAALSPFHFHRIFSVIMGETPNAYLNRLRLERAANRLIKEPRSSITDIAFDCGYSSSSVFARAFRAHFGQTAGEFRKKTGEIYRERLVQQPFGDQAAEAHWVADVKIKQMPAMHVAYVANRQGYRLDRICAAWERLTRWAKAHSWLTPETRWIGVSLDDPFITTHNRCRYLACLTVPAGAVERDGPERMEIAGGIYAVCRVACRAEEISRIYPALYALWLPESGFRPADLPVYELYLETPETSANGQYLLEVCLPVQ